MHSHLLKPLLLALQSEASTSIDLLDLSRGGGEYRLVKARPTYTRKVIGWFLSVSQLLSCNSGKKTNYRIFLTIPFWVTTDMHDDAVF